MIGGLSFLGALSFSSANACSPASLTPQQIIEYSDHIIIARAVESKWVAEHEPGLVTAALEFLRELLPYDEMSREGETKFQIRRTIKGDAAGYITIRHNVSPSMCGITFNAYDNNLLFVSEYKRKYFTNAFGVRPFLSQAEYQELLELLGVREDDYVGDGENYLEPIDGR